MKGEYCAENNPLTCVVQTTFGLIPVISLFYFQWMTNKYMKAEGFTQQIPPYTKSHIYKLIGSILLGIFSIIRVILEITSSDDTFVVLSYIIYISFIFISGLLTYIIRQEYTQLGYTTPFIRTFILVFETCYSIMLVLSEIFPGGESVNGFTAKEAFQIIILINTLIFGIVCFVFKSDTKNPSHVDIADFGFKLKISYTNALKERLTNENEDQISQDNNQRNTQQSNLYMRKSILSEYLNNESIQTQEIRTIMSHEFSQDDINGMEDQKIKLENVGVHSIKVIFEKIKKIEQNNKQTLIFKIQVKTKMNDIHETMRTYEEFIEYFGYMKQFLTTIQYVYDEAKNFDIQTKDKKLIGKLTSNLGIILKYIVQNEFLNQRFYNFVASNLDNLKPIRDLYNSTPTPNENNQKDDEENNNKSQNRTSNRKSSKNLKNRQTKEESTEQKGEQKKESKTKKNENNDNNYTDQTKEQIKDEDKLLEQNLKFTMKEIQNDNKVGQVSDQNKNKTDKVEDNKKQQIVDNKKQSKQQEEDEEEEEQKNAENKVDQIKQQQSKDIKKNEEQRNNLKNFQDNSNKILDIEKQIANEERQYEGQDIKEKTIDQLFKNKNQDIISQRSSEQDRSMSYHISRDLNFGQQLLQQQQSQQNQSQDDNIIDSNNNKKNININEKKTSTTFFSVQFIESKIIDSYAVYVFKIKERQSGWELIIEKRYSQFEKLHNSLKPVAKAIKNILPSLPYKSSDNSIFTSSKDANLIKYRSSELKKYLQRLLLDRTYSKESCVLQFIGYQNESQQQPSPIRSSNKQK